MSHIDQIYIDGLLRNDKEVVGKIYKNFFNKVKWMIINNNGSIDDASDIFQEALIAIYNRALRDDFRLTCPFEAFLLLVCKKKWLNVLEKNKRMKVTNLEDDGYLFKDSQDQISEETVLHEERLELLRKNFSLLGDVCRQLLELSWQDNSMEEVAKILGITYGYARKKKSECVAKLVTLVKQSPDFQNLKW